MQLYAGVSAILTYLGLAIATIVAGLVLRLAPLGLPFVVVMWSGSVLWAAMAYWLFAAFLPFRKPLSIAEAAAVFAALVELFRLYHTPELDAFRLTLAGALLLGRVFSWWHLLAYWVAILLAALADRWIIRRKTIRRGQARAG